MKQYSELTKRKIQLYFACNYLYSLGKSHPQVVEVLSEYEPNNELLSSIANAAGNDQWRIIFNESQRLTSLGKNYQEIFDAVKPMESDPEVVHFICETWYGVQSMYAENIIEGPTHIQSGIKMIIASSLGLILMFSINSSLLAKMLWSIGLILGLFLWLYGRHQINLGKGLKDILEKDYTQLGKLI